MKIRKALIGGLLVGVVVAAVAIWGESGQSDDQPVDPVASPSMVAHIDPETGELIAGPASGQPGEIGDTVKQSDAGLVEELSPVPGGGVMVDLQGRFQHTVIVTSDSDSVNVRCVPDSQASQAAEGDNER